MQSLILVLLTLLSLVQLSCKKSEQSSVLLVAVDKLKVTDVNCSLDDKTNSGFQMLCNESIRFTHAFTPSTLTNPALGSLLTGLYPYQHRVRHNGGPGLSPENELVSEVALNHKYRTGFFSGGAPVLRRSGLGQGFEVFEDNILPSISGLFRPFKKNVEIFNSWLSQDVEDDPFFGVIYVPDLLFTSTVTTNHLGETRNLSFESQVDEFDETLFEMFKTLKQLKKWDNLTIILVGLNGQANGDRPNEFSHENLHGENTQVALLIKPPRLKIRDEVTQWKIDQNVTLVDIGRTLFELLGQSPVNDNSFSFPAFSLLDLLKNPYAIWSEERPLLIESGWANWRFGSPIFSGIIAGHVLYLNQDKPLLFNTLVDRFETNPLPILQESILPVTLKIQGLITKNQFVPFKKTTRELISKYSIPFERWLIPENEKMLLRELKKLYVNSPNDSDLANWTAQIALNQNDWETLKLLGTRFYQNDWIIVANKNLNLTDKKKQDPCFELLNTATLDSEKIRQCNEPLFIELIDWLRAEDRGLSKEIQRKRFERSFKNYMLDQMIQRTNIASGLIWDTSRTNIFSPSKTEMALHFPELSKIKSQIYRSIQIEDQANIYSN